MYVRFVFLLQKDADTTALLALLDNIRLTRDEDYIVTHRRGKAMNVAMRSLRPAIIFTCLGDGGLRPEDCMRLANEVGRSVMTIAYDNVRPSIEMREMLDGWMKPDEPIACPPLYLFLLNYFAGSWGDQLVLGLRV